MTSQSKKYYSSGQKVLVAHRGIGLGTPDGHQARPFVSHAAKFQQEDTRIWCLKKDTDSDAWVSMAAEVRPDVVVDFRHWSESPEQVRPDIIRLREAIPHVRYVLMDYYDPTASPHLSLIDNVDIYAKRQVLADRGLYESDFAGGFIFTDFLVSQMGFEIGEWRVGVSTSAEQAEKIMPVWNLGAVDHYNRLACTGPAQCPWRLRPIGVHARLGVGPSRSCEQWYQQYRRMCVQVLEAYTGKFSRITRGIVSKKRYFAELMASKVVFSPFGWGEVCFRDYEAVACGCLLLKQDMSHLTTEPDIYRPMQTYIPIRWDLSDMHDRLAWIEKNPREAADIARRGRQALRDYFRNGGAWPTIRRLLRQVVSPN